MQPAQTVEELLSLFRLKAFAHLSTSQSRLSQVNQQEILNHKLNQTQHHEPSDND